MSDVFIDVLNPEKQLGFVALGLIEDVSHQKYENKTEGFRYYVIYSFGRSFKISLRFKYRALDPKLTENLI